MNILMSDFLDKKLSTKMAFEVTVVNSITE